LETDATLEQWITVLSGLGLAIASWQRLNLRDLPRWMRSRSPQRLRDFARLLDRDALRDAASQVACRLDLPSRRATAWLRELEPLASMAPVLVHGDINEGQILVDDSLQVTGILDWETAGVGHPLKDFDFGEWGYGIFAWEPRFDVLRRHMWDAYTRTGGGELPSWRAVHLFFCLTSIAQFSQEEVLTAWGRHRLANNVDLLKRLDDR
jgi:aminoglycoside phosphotransferase (APT) family kinase protein